MELCCVSSLGTMLVNLTDWCKTDETFLCV